MTDPASGGRHLLIAGTSLPDVEAALAIARLVLDRLPAAPAGLLVQTNLADLVLAARQRMVAASGQLRSVPSSEDGQRGATRLPCGSASRTLQPNGRRRGAAMWPRAISLPARAEPWRAKISCCSASAPCCGCAGRFW